MASDETQPYYLAYDRRYRAAYAQGADRYAVPADEEKVRTLVRQYVARFRLDGKRVIEFGCGEGVTALELARLGCIYHGYDVSPAAIEKAAAMLSGFPNVKVAVADAVLESFPEKAFDAGIDISCLHMLVVDADHQKYLKNVFNCLKPNAPMYFVTAGYKEDAYEGQVSDCEQWLLIFGKDTVTPQRRTAQKDGQEIQVMLPLIAYRPRTERGYRAELTAVGFDIVEFEKAGESANILVKKHQALIDG